MFFLTSLNLNGIRSAANKGVEAWIEKAVSQNALDCMCVQELKAQATDVFGRFESIAGMKGYFQFAQKRGYSGVGVYCRHEPSDVVVGFDSAAGGEFDAEGRFVELRFDTPAHKRSIISSYFPSGSSGEDRQAAKFRFLDLMYPHLIKLKKKRSFILCGDINIAHQNIDLKNWKSNQKNSGFTPQERAWMSQLTAVVGGADQGAGCIVDVYRQLEPTAAETAYTWWSQRGAAYENNVGWRLDYHLATSDLASLARGVDIYKKEKFSDHAPVTIQYDFKL